MPQGAAKMCVHLGRVSRMVWGENGLGLESIPLPWGEQDGPFSFLGLCFLIFKVKVLCSAKGNSTGEAPGAKVCSWTVFKLCFLRKPKHLTGRLSVCLSPGNHGPYDEQRMDHSSEGAQIHKLGALLRFPAAK